MGKRKCPVCGKAIAAQAQYCIYCSARFDSLEEDIDATRVIENVKDTDENIVSEVKPKKAFTNKSKIWFFVTISALLVIFVVLLLFFTDPPQTPSEQEGNMTQPTTTTTRDAARDAMLQTFTGHWVDSASAGKKHLESQGGQVLFIHEIFRDTVDFDLMSYSGGSDKQFAAVHNIKAVLDDTNTLHFTFDNDLRGHSGEGFMRLQGDVVQLEVLINEQDSLSDDEHSLAMYTEFSRRSLPRSEGHDVSKLTTLAQLQEIAGEQTAEPVTDEKTQHTTYVFGAVSAIADQNGALVSLTVDYGKQDKKDAFCFECIDGTMTYEVVKNYFGEAEQDYVEQPTNIRVLRYLSQTFSSVTFTFDAEDNLLMHIEFVR